MNILDKILLKVEENRALLDDISRHMVRKPIPKEDKGLLKKANKALKEDFESKSDSLPKCDVCHKGIIRTNKKGEEIECKYCDGTGILTEKQSKEGA